MNNEKRVDKLSLKFLSKTVALVYPDSKINPICLQYCFGFEESKKLYRFFDECDCVYDIDTDVGMTANAIFVSFKYDTPDEVVKEICEKAIELMWEGYTDDVPT